MHGQPLPSCDWIGTGVLLHGCMLRVACCIVACCGLHAASSHVACIAAGAVVVSLPCCMLHLHAAPSHSCTSHRCIVAHASRRWDRNRFACAHAASLHATFVARCIAWTLRGLVRNGRFRLRCGQSCARLRAVGGVRRRRVVRRVRALLRAAVSGIGLSGKGLSANNGKWERLGRTRVASVALLPSVAP